MPPDWIVVALEIRRTFFCAGVTDRSVGCRWQYQVGSPLVDLTSNSPPSINVNLAMPLETISAPGATPPTIVVWSDVLSGKLSSNVPWMILVLVARPPSTANTPMVMVRGVGDRELVRVDRFTAQ